MVKNCVNCGAPIFEDEDKCSYCGTSYDIKAFKSYIENHTGTITVAGHTYRVYLGDCQVNNLWDIPRRNVSGELLTTHQRIKRKFTLIEI